MKRRKSILVFILSLAMLAGVTESKAAEENVKTYLLKDLKTAVSNSDKCESHLKDLEPLTKKPFSLKFTKHPDGGGKHSVEDLSGQISNHTHTILKQHAAGGKVHRVGMGSFKVGATDYDYVLEIAANVDNEKHHYLYPVILASDDASCYFTGLVDPSDETVTSFKKSIKDGTVKDGADLR